MEDRINFISCYLEIKEYGKDNIMTINEYVEETIIAAKKMYNKQISIIKTRDNNGYYLGLVYDDTTHIAFVNNDRFNFAELSHALNDNYINWKYDTEESTYL